MKDINKIIKNTKKLNIKSTPYIKIRKNIILYKFRKKLCKVCKSKKMKFCVLCLDKIDGINNKKIMLQHRKYLLYKF